jgi:hypothetical protein
LTAFAVKNRAPFPIVFCALSALALSACAEKPQPQPQPNEPSPNASILPAPLASAIEPPPKVSPVDAGKQPEGGFDGGSFFAPEAVRDDRPLRSDVLPREPSSLRLFVELRWLDLPAFPRLPETNAEAVQRQRDAPGFMLMIELSLAGRLRAVFDSEAFVFPKGTELRAREDYYGHVLVFDDTRSYTPVAPGTLRALLGERRMDAAPLTKPKVTELGNGGVFGLPTVRRELATPLGRLVLDQANTATAGAGATLLCRLLTELIAADPANDVCARRELPVRAELFSSGGGHLLFELRRLQRDAAVDPLNLLTPPAEARFAPEELPEPPREVLPKTERLHELRTRPIPRTEKPDPAAPKEGLTIQNRTESLRFVLLDGFALARVPPRKEVHVSGLVPGKYGVASLDFFGDDPSPLRVIEVPGRFSVGDVIEPER